jgi:hypothetical protein
VERDESKKVVTGGGAFDAEITKGTRGDFIRSQPLGFLLLRSSGRVSSLGGSDRRQHAENQGHQNSHIGEEGIQLECIVGDEVPKMWREMIPLGSRFAMNPRGGKGTTRMGLISFRGPQIQAVRASVHFNLGARIGSPPHGGDGPQFFCCQNVLLSSHCLLCAHQVRKGN